MTAIEKKQFVKAMKGFASTLKAQKEMIILQGKQIEILLEALSGGVVERKRLERRVSTLEANMKDALLAAGQALLATDALGRQTWVH